MKRALVLATAAAAALSLVACHKNAGNTTATGNTAETPGATGNSAISAVNPSQAAPVNQAENAVGAAVGSTSAATLGSHDNGAFVKSLVQGNNYEIAAAKIALQKSKSPDVKSFARMMVHDHTALGDEAKPVIAKAGLTAPTDLDQRLKGLLENLRKASPQDFDKIYVDQQVAAHQETLTLLNGYSQNGDNADLKALDAKATPIVQKHLDAAQALQAKLAGGSGPTGNSAG